MVKKPSPKTHFVKCPRQGCNNPAIISPVWGILPCQSCQDKDNYHITKSPEFYTITRRDRVQKIRDEHAKDLIQPYIRDKINKDFAEAYPDMAKTYYKKEELESL